MSVYRALLLPPSSSLFIIILSGCVGNTLLFGTSVRVFFRSFQEPQPTSPGWLLVVAQLHADRSMTDKLIDGEIGCVLFAIGDTSLGVEEKPVKGGGFD